jgi:hypothetical protein
MAFLLKDDLLALQNSLPPQTTLEEIGVKVSETLERTKEAIPDSSRKLFWEACLRDDILNLAVGLNLPFYKSSEAGHLGYGRLSSGWGPVAILRTDAREVGRNPCTDRTR